MAVAGSPQIGRPAGAHNANRSWFGLSTEWMADKACTLADRHLFFSENNSKRLVVRMAEMQAKQICAGCPVKGACLDYAIEGDMYGIWGGMTRDERDREKKRRRRATVAADRPPTS